MNGRGRLRIALLLGVTMSPAFATEEFAIPPSGTVVGRVILDKSNIFDLSNPDEDKWLYRLANRLHIVTRDSTIEKQLLFAPGEPYSQRLVEESERILRQRRYIYDADIRALQVRDGVVDVAVKTRDVWSLAPEFSVSRGGGEDRWRIGLEESNLFGRGQLLQFTYDDGVDRTSKSLGFVDDHLGRSWVSLLAAYADNSDGESQLLSVVRPFYALDTRRAGGGSVFADDKRDRLYLSGTAEAEYRHERDFARLFAGWSRGLRGARARRWTVGLVHDDNRFAAPPAPALPVAIPDNLRLVYPYVGFELVEDEFVTTHNRDQIARTEDFLMGLRVTASLGWSDRSFGADRDALVYAASISRGFGALDGTALLFDVAARGRLDSGDHANATLSAEARFYHRQSAKRLFFASLGGTAGHNLDLDNPVYLGGKTGLRGYPLRYRSAASRLVLTAEQRYFSNWYPFRLFRVGGALFADIGRTWGPNPIGDEPREWLSNVGFGLRLSPTRFSSRKVFHLDIAFPLNGDSTIDSVQISFGSKKTF